MGLVRRTYALPVEMAILGVVVLLWQLARIPLEASLEDAVASTRAWISVERALGILWSRTSCAGRMRGRTCSPPRTGSSLHVGIPALVAAAAIWMRPRSPLAWASVAYPLVVLAVVVGTANHFVLDAVVGVAWGAIAFAVNVVVMSFVG